jgi:hypothetical protein
MASGLVRAGRPIVVPTPAASDQATPRSYVDAGDALAVPLTSVGVASGVAPLDAGGRLPSGDLPFGWQNGVSGAAASTTTITLGADVTPIRTMRLDTGATSTTTIAVPNGSLTSAQVIRGRVHNNSGNAQNVVFASGLRTSTGLTRGPFSVPNGEVFIFTLECLQYFHSTTSTTYLSGIWAITAYTTTAA